MEIFNSTVIITGGSSGIGFEICKRLLQKGNTVITCSGSAEKLGEAKKQLPGLITYQCDLSQFAECEKLVKWTVLNFPSVNVLINNAATATRSDFISDATIIEKLEKEIAVNFKAPVYLIKSLYPLMAKNNRALIVNITSGLVYVPTKKYTFYNATKSALHSFTQVLRLQLQQQNVKITEVLFPVVDTPWHNGKVPKGAISAEDAVDEMLRGIKDDKAEIRISKVKLLYFLNRIAPDFMFKKINSMS
ncbi:SDR family oxidoreductase [Flavobacterium sp. ARAG 55.4]|uniref:SDR family oxidoreductase n=1 Tax=Flavobacterium sp. ARAG 55.4 TaxID=3451357 RepID=UPI003F48AB25